MLQGIAEKHTDGDGSHCHLLVRLVLNFPSSLQKEKVLLNYINHLGK